MVGSEELNSKLKTTPNISSRNWQAEAALPTTTATEENS